MKNNFTLLQYVFTFFMYFLGGCLFCIALVPPFSVFFGLWQAVNPQTVLSKAMVLSAGAGFGYFLFGFSLALETIVIRMVLNLKLKEGEYSFFSLSCVKWAFVNAMTLIVNLSFMDYMRLTPLLPLYYKLMGANIGKRVQINTKGIADLSMIEIGDDSVIGGDAVLIGHIAEHGKLKLKKTKVGKKVTVGLGAVIMPGCAIGDGALIAARSVLPKNTVVPARSLFAGTPARFVKSLDEEDPKIDE